MRPAKPSATGSGHCALSAAPENSVSLDLDHPIVDDMECVKFANRGS